MTNTLCTACEESHEGQILIASWKVLIHLLETSKEKIDIHYLVGLLLKAGVRGEQTMPLFEMEVLAELERRREERKQKKK